LKIESGNGKRQKRAVGVGGNVDRDG